MGTKISALTTTGTAPGGAYVPLAYGGENYKIDAANLTVGSSNSSTPSMILGGYEVISSSTTWTAPDNATVIWLTMVGGGAGGGAGWLNSSNGAGGGGGGALYDYFVNVSGGHDYTITIGAGGLGAIGTYPTITAGAVGNDSIFEKTTDSSFIITCGGGGVNSSYTSGPGGTLTTGANLIPTDITHIASAATLQYPNGSTELVGGDGEQGYGGHYDNGRSQPGYGGDSGFPMIAAYNAGLSTAGAQKADAGYAWPGWGRYPNSDRSSAQNWGGAGSTDAAWGGYLGGGGAGLLNVSSAASAFQYGGDGIALIRTVVNEE